MVQIRKSLLVAVILFLFLSAPAVQAQPTPDEASRNLLRYYDVDKNGAIGKEEWKKNPTWDFDRYDKNKDGQMHLSEILVLVKDELARQNAKDLAELNGESLRSFTRAQLLGRVPFFYRYLGRVNLEGFFVGGISFRGFGWGGWTLSRWNLGRFWAWKLPVQNQGKK